MGCEVRDMECEGCGCDMRGVSCGCDVTGVKCEVRDVGCHGCIPACLPITTAA